VQGCSARGVRYEALQEARRQNLIGLAGGRALGHVGDLRLDVIVKIRVIRERPDAFA
jgi:hypothetical protein